MFDFRNGNNFGGNVDWNIPMNGPENGGVMNPNPSGENTQGFPDPLPSGGYEIEDNTQDLNPQRPTIGTATKNNFFIRRFPAWRGIPPQKFVVHYRYAEGSSQYQLKVERMVEKDGINVFSTSESGWMSHDRFNPANTPGGPGRAFKKTDAEMKKQAQYSARYYAIEFYTRELMKTVEDSPKNIRENIVIPWIDGSGSRDSNPTMLIIIGVITAGIVAFGGMA